MAPSLVDQLSFPKFISNVPLGEDLFEGKSQEKVAKIIAQTILKNDQMQVIGIDGGWGTGKSNLIEIIKVNLNSGENDKFHFFIYDAWAHQEDLQRRSFLEELTDYLTKSGTEGDSIIKQPEKWKEKLKQLLAKAKETQTKTVPSLSLGIVISALALITTPIFKAVSDGIESNWIKVLVTAIPLLAVLGIFLYHFFNTRQSGNWLKHLKDVAARLFQVYQENQIENTTFETISEDEPSVRKFRRWMDEISTDLNGSKLVIVFDNMDRLPGAKVLQLWSSIHTFFAESQYDNIKVLVPFDRQNINEAFKSSLPGEKAYANDYINKTFNVVYRVSPVILSDWKRFFEIKWKEAFGSTNDEYERVIQIFDHLALSKTPREIVVFINDFVGTVQINNEIPHRYIALFLVNKEVILAKPDAEILSPTYLESLNFIYQIDEDLPKYIAALLYQIEPDRSIEVIFTGKLTSALNNNKKEDIINISEAPSFQHILSTSITQVENYENAVLGLEHISDKVNQKNWDDLYSKLDDRSEKLQESKIQPFNLILLKMISGKSSYLNKTIRRLAGAEKLVALDYYNSLQTLRNFIADNSLELDFEDALLDVKVTPGDYLLLIKTTEKKSTCRIDCDNGELNTYLIENSDSELYTNSSHLANLPDSHDLSAFLLALEENIKKDQDSRILVADYYRCYKNVARGKRVPLLDDNYIYTHFANSVTPYDDLYYDLIAMRISKLSTFATYESYFEEVLRDTSDALTQKVADTLQHFMDYDDILLSVPNFDKPLLKNLARLMTTDAIETKFADVPSVLKEIDAICDEGIIDMKLLTQKLDEWPVEEVKLEEIADVIPNLKFFTECLSSETSLAVHCLKLANEYFDGMSTEEWKAKFVEKDLNFIKVSLITSNKSYNAKAFKAIKEVLNQIASKEILLPDKELWSKIIAKSNIASVKATLKNLRDLFNSSIIIDAKLFEFYGNWLFEYGEMQESADSLRRILNIDVIKSEVNLNIVLNYRDRFRHIYGASADKGHFLEELKSILEDGNSRFHEVQEILEKE